MSTVLCCAWSFSPVWLFVTPWTIAHQAPLPMGILQARGAMLSSRTNVHYSSIKQDYTSLPFQLCFDYLILMTNKI